MFMELPFYKMSRTSFNKNLRIKAPEQREKPQQDVGEDKKRLGRKIKIMIK